MLIIARQTRDVICSVSPPAIIAPTAPRASVCAPMLMPVCSTRRNLEGHPVLILRPCLIGCFRWSRIEMDDTVSVSATIGTRSL